MYKFAVIEGGCGKNSYDIKKAENTANEMLKHNYELVQVYQTSTAGCGGANSALVMVFKHQGRQ